MRMPLFVLILGALVSIACDAQQDEGPFCMISRPGKDLYLGEMSALRNGERWIVSPWRGTLFAVSDEERETMTIAMDVFNEKVDTSPPPASFPRESILFSDVPKLLGTYPLPGRTVQTDAHFFTKDPSDAPGLAYELDKSETGFISIDAYDRSSCTIQGTFSFTVVAKTPGGTYPYVDTLRFTEGRFHTHVVTYFGEVLPFAWIEG